MYTQLSRLGTHILACSGVLYWVRVSFLLFLYLYTWLVCYAHTPPYIVYLQTAHLKKGTILEARISAVLNP